MAQLQDITWRPLRAADYEQLKAAHAAAFPIDYEDGFFQRAVLGTDGIISFCAVHRSQGTLIGFLTARTFYLHQCSPIDRTLTGLGSKLLDQEEILYILTLGVAEGWRGLGIASALVQSAVRHAAQRAARAVYLHVISYNVPAMRLYARAGFREAAVLRKFYNISTGRTPDPSQRDHDAYLMVYTIDVSVQTSPITILIAAFAPFRSILSHAMACWRPSSRHSFRHMFKHPPPPVQGEGQPRIAPEWLSHIFSRT